jgi:hypothetical protein
MTDENPSPTTRLPVPDPPVTPDTPDTQRAGVPEPTPVTDTNDTQLAMTAPPPPTTAPPATTPQSAAPPAAAPVATSSRRDEPDQGRTASILFGLVFLGLGLWFFAEITLGYDLPNIQWSQVWPVFLIVIGLWIVLGTRRRGSR